MNQPATAILSEAGAATLDSLAPGVKTKKSVHFHDVA